MKESVIRVTRGVLAGSSFAWLLLDDSVPWWMLTPMVLFFAWRWWVRRPRVQKQFALTQPKLGVTAAEFEVNL